MSRPGPWIDAGTPPAPGDTVFVWWPCGELGVAVNDRADIWWDCAIGEYADSPPLWWMPVPPLPGSAP